MNNEYVETQREYRTMDQRLEQIRDSERKSHMEIYTDRELYQKGSWLEKPVRTVMDLMPLFAKYRELHVLDLGCGVGRNGIAIARHFQDIPCIIDSVDILELAIEKLCANAEKYGVSASIQGAVCPMEKYPVREDYYDLVLAISALEHVDSRESFARKLDEMNAGIRKGGAVCLIVNSQVRETDPSSGIDMPAQFEVNLPTEELQELLRHAFCGWTVLKSTIQSQQYDIPREQGVRELHTNVVTFVARKGEKRMKSTAFPLAPTHP